MNYLVTYEDAMEMVKVYKDFNFSKSEYMLNGYKVVTFGYFLCDYNTFMNPLVDKPGVNGLDMRGVTFVFNKDGSLYKRFFMLKKFFNLNQVESTLYHNVKDKEIKGVTEKEDGSLIAFMELPDRSIFAKTIGSFNNEQSIAAMNLHNSDKDLQTFIRIQLNADFTPMFEYVSWDNRIVLKYSKAELRLIGARNNENGDWHASWQWKHIKKSNLVITKSAKEFSLDELIEKAKSEQDKEGWVIEFKDGQMIKIKTEWYFNLHGIRTTNVFREDWVIKNYLEENLDDAVGQLDKKEDVDAFKFMDRVTLAVDNYIKAIDEGVARLKKIYETEYKSDWPSYATFNNKEAFFGLSVTAIQSPELYNQRKLDFIINKTKHLNKAKFFVDKWSEQSDESISKWKK